MCETWLWILLFFVVVFFFNFSNRWLFDRVKLWRVTSVSLFNTVLWVVFVLSYRIYFFFLLFYKPTLMFTKTVIYCLQTYLYLLKYESIQNLFQEKLHWHTCSTQTYLPCFLLSMKLWWTIISSYTKMAFVSVALLKVNWKFNLHFHCIYVPSFMQRFIRPPVGLTNTGHNTGVVSLQS